MKRLALFSGLLIATCGSLMAREFTVLVYNVENLFDLDGVALYSQYEQGPDGPYGPDQLLGKLESIHSTLASIDDGAGPEVILFQEFELDRTPFDTPSAKAFLQSAKGTSLETLLHDDPQAANLPVELLLLKYLEDQGLSGYHIAQPDSFHMESHPPHKNVIFSRFPVRYVQQRPMEAARDLLVAGLDIDGQELILLNNHWKSGASDLATEAIRVQNALVVRAEVEAILLKNPQADVIIAGDLNSYYNHKASFAGQLEETGVNDVLPTHGFESRMTGEDAEGLYNLWFELPVDQRGSEVWRGKWGTLMQMILTPGLYDQRGIQYVDNSFERLLLPGENIDSHLVQPIAWTNHGKGSGYSDHLPIYARFRSIAGEGTEGWLKLKNPANEKFRGYRPAVSYAHINFDKLPSVDSLGLLSASQQAELMGELFRINHPLVSVDPVQVQIGDQLFGFYSPFRDVRDALNSIKLGETVKGIVELDDWRGNLQFVFKEEAWFGKD